MKVFFSLEFLIDENDDMVFRRELQNLYMDLCWNEIWDEFCPSMGVFNAKWTYAA